MQTAENVARQVLDGCRVNVNEEQMETMKALKKFLRGRYINVDESLKEDIGDFKDFKKLNRALHFREDGSGTGVDSLWLELQDQFGEGLFPEDVQNPADQIKSIFRYRHVYPMAIEAVASGKINFKGIVTDVFPCLTSSTPWTSASAIRRTLSRQSLKSKNNTDFELEHPQFKDFAMARSALGSTSGGAGSPNGLTEGVSCWTW